MQTYEQSYLVQGLATVGDVGETTGRIQSKENTSAAYCNKVPLKMVKLTKKTNLTYPNLA